MTDRICTVEDCGRPATTRGWCNRHYEYWRLHGVPERPNAVERFWAKVNKQGPVPAHRPELGPCWVWTGTVPKQPGYGRFNTGIKLAGRWVIVNVHRYSWELHHGPVPAGLWVLHRCDNRPCVRPDHLFLGTATDNNRDMVAKGRHWRTKER